MTFRLIEQKAESLLRRYNLFNAPVPVKRLIRELGVELKPDRLGEEVSGLLFVEKNRKVIGYNLIESKVRQRFTMAHEIGHLLLHCDTENKKERLFVDNIMYRKNYSSENEKKREMQANSFAAALLMPRDLLRKSFEELLNSNISYSDEEIVEELAAKFQVSSIAMSYRLFNLNILRR